MRVIYEAWHYKIDAHAAPDRTDEQQSAKRLGDYSTRANAEAAIERRRSELGFRDWPYGFRIEVTPLDLDMPPATGKVERLYCVWHFQIGAADQEEYDDPAQKPREIGNYTSEANAKLAVERHKSLPEFLDFPDGFRIESAPPDIDHWVEGFVSWDEA